MGDFKYIIRWCDNHSRGVLGGKDLKLAAHGPTNSHFDKLRMIFFCGQWFAVELCAPGKYEAGPFL